MYIELILERFRELERLSDYTPELLNDETFLEEYDILKDKIIDHYIKEYESEKRKQ